MSEEPENEPHYQWIHAATVVLAERRPTMRNDSAQEILLALQDARALATAGLASDGPPPALLKAMLTTLLDSGDLTPTAQRQILKLWEASQ